MTNSASTRSEAETHIEQFRASVRSGGSLKKPLENINNSLVELERAELLEAYELGRTNALRMVKDEVGALSAHDEKLLHEVAAALNNFNTNPAFSQTTPHLAAAAVRAATAVHDRIKDVTAERTSRIAILNAKLTVPHQYGPAPAASPMYSAVASELSVALAELQTKRNHTEPSRADQGTSTSYAKVAVFMADVLLAAALGALVVWDLPRQAALAIASAALSAIVVKFIFLLVFGQYLFKQQTPPQGPAQ